MDTGLNFSPRSEMSTGKTTIQGGEDGGHKPSALKSNAEGKSKKDMPMPKKVLEL